MQKSKGAPIPAAVPYGEGVLFRLKNSSNRFAGSPA